MGSQKPKVLLLGDIEHAHDAWKTLGDIAELIGPKARERDEFLEECKSGALDGVIATYRTFDSVKITGRFDEDLINALPKSLKFICHNGAGYDQVEIPPCTARGIRVSNVPTAVDDATADTNMFLILGALRGYNPGLFSLREGKWRGGRPRRLCNFHQAYSVPGHPPPPLGHDPEGKLLGILGMGGIGRNLKKKAEAFGMRVQYHNRRKLSDELAGGAKYVSFDELLSTSDVISLNLPLNVRDWCKVTHKGNYILTLLQNNTRHMISTHQFEKMKTGVVIVNTARGAVIDEDALVQALDSKKVRSCGLDVYEAEPQIHPGLVANPGVLLVPHLGTYTVETQTAMETWNIDNVRSAVETGKLKSPVNEQADMK
ncbi:MAG: hypothetical protein M1833_001340 [Piccolia ochrophora]|nr:MAG: hypothetical protein M1833_001340 [Piccolia ochrophora]